MIKDLRNTFKQTAIYGVSSLLVKVAGLILLPIYTNSLSTEAFGLLGWFELITLFFVGVISFSLPSSMLRLASETNDIESQNKIYATSLLMILFFGGIFLAIFLPLNSILSQAIFHTDEYAPYFTIAFISIVVEILGVLPLQLLRLREKSTQFLGFYGLKLISLIGFVWYFVSVKELGVYGALWGFLCANITFLLSTFVFQFKNLVLKFDKKAAREMYYFGAPLIFTTIAGTLLTIADRIIIEIYGQLSDLGIYTMAYKIGSLSNLLIIGSFSLGFLPIAFKKFGDANFDRFYSKMFTYFIGITILVTLVVSLFSKEGIKLISSTNPDYWLAVNLVPFIAYMFLFKALTNYISYIFLLTKHTKYQAYVTIAGMVINISLNFLLIPKYNMQGAILATGISYICMTIMTYIMAQRNYRIDYEFKRISVLMVSCAVFIAIGVFFNDLNLLNRIIIKTALTVGYTVFVFYAVADKVERDKVQKITGIIRKDGIKGLLGSLKKTN